MAKRKYKTDLVNSRLYRIWAHMKNRCIATKGAEYRNYSSRGITVCDEWKNDFLTFYNWAMANGYSDNLSIDRINNDKGYYPDNCRWATAKQQVNNTRVNNRITFNGETYSFNASRARVMEHVRWFAPNPEHYIENKDLVVEHFRRMAMASYAMSHFPKAIKKTMKEHHISTYER